MSPTVPRSGRFLNAPRAVKTSLALFFRAGRFQRAFFLLFAFLTVHFSIQAQNSSTIGSGNWNNPAIWLGGLVPTGANPVFINTGHTVTLVANTVTTNILSVTGTLNMAGFNMTAGSITGSGTIRSSSGSPTLTVGTDNSTGTFGGIIGSGAITLVKVGNGVLGLSADNTYTGNTNIQVGALRALGNNVFGTVGSITVSSGASLQVEGGITLNRNISMVGTGVGGAGAIHNNSGDNTLSGTVTLTGASSIESQGGTLIFSATLAGGVHALTFSGNGNFSATGSITGSGAVTKTGNGTLIIPTAKTFSGSKAINQGAINVQHANALGTSGTITVNSGGALQFEGGITFSRPFSINGTGTSNTGAIRNISGTNTLSGAITLSSASKVGSDDGTLVLSAATTLSGAGHDVTFGGNGSINVTGALSLGAGALVKENNGTTTLFVSNTYTGGTTTNAGILAIRNAGALGASGTITITPNSSLQLENNISVSRVLNINGNGFGNNGAIRSDGNNTISSTVQLDGSARIYSDNGTLTLSNGTSVSGSGLTVTFGGNSNITVSGSLAMGSGGMTKFSNGTLTLNAASTYTGTTTLSGGTVLPTNMNAFGTSGTVVINSSGTLQLQGGVTFARPIELGSNGSGNIGGIRSASGNNSITGLITLIGNGRINTDANTLTLTGANIIDGTNQTLVLGGAGNMTVNRAISHTTGGLTKADAGTVLLNVPNTYTGTTTVSGGILRYGTNNIIATGNVTVNGGTLDIQGFNDTVGQISVSSGQIIGTGTLSSSDDFNFSGGTIDIILAGNVGLVKTGGGTLVLTGANTFTGQVWIQNGILSVASMNRVVGGSASSNLGTPNSAANGTIRLGSGGSTGRLEYTGAAFTTDRVIELAGTSGGGEIRHNGSGALVFTADMVVTGAGNKDFILGGSNNAFNEFQGDIVDFNASNRTSLVVNGGGFWSLPNAKSFSGDTDLSTNNTILHIENSLSLGTGGAARRITINVNTRLELVGGVTGIELFQEIYLRGFGGVGSNACLLSINGNNVLHGTLYMTNTTRIDAEADSLTFNGSPFAIRSDNNGNRALTLGGDGQLTFVGEFSQGGLDGGAGSLTKLGNGVLHLIGARTSSGTFTMNAGSLLLGADERLSDNCLVSVNNATTWDMNGFSETVQRISSNNGNSTITNNGAAACTLILDNSSTAISGYSGRIDDGTGIIHLRVRGTGTQTLSGLNSTYTGTTTVNDGVLNITGSMENYGVTSAIGRGTAGQPIEITGGGELRINRNQTNTVNRDFVLTGPGTISKYNGGTITLTGSLTSANFPLTLFADNSRTAVFSGNIDLGTATLTKGGAGLWELGGSGNVYSGNTNIDLGTLRIGHPNAIPSNSPVVNNATLDLSGNSITMASLAGTDPSAEVRTNVGGTATITFSNSSGDITYSGNLIDGTGTLAIVKGGAYTQRLGGVNTYTGSTTINGGVLKAVSATSISSASDFELADVAGATLDVTGFNNTIGALRGGGATGGDVLLGTATLSIGSNNLDATYSGTITGVSTGGIEKVGTGVFTLTRNPAYSGLTIVSNGTLRAGNDLVFDGVLTISSGALFDCDNFQSSAFFISFDNLRQLPGSWGHPQSPAQNKSTVYFERGRGIIVAIDGLEHGYWLGTTSTDWFTASNWHNDFIPDDTTKAVIEYVAINNPVIGGTATCEDLEIFPDASVTITGSNVLDVHGDFLNYGTFVPNSSTVNFRKATGVTQVVTQPTIGPFANLQYFGSGTLRLSSNLPVPFLMSGALITSAGGTIDLNGKGLDCGGIAGDGLITNTQPFSVVVKMTNSAGTLTFSGTLQNGSGTVALEKLGTATQIMEGNSSYSGGTTISGGTVWARNLTTALGTGTITMNGTAPVLRISNAAGSSLNLNSNVVVDVNATVIADNNSAGVGAIHQLGTLTLNAGSLTISGGEFVNSGTTGINFGATTHSVNPTYTVSNPINGGDTRLSLGALTGADFNTIFQGDGDVQQTGAWAINPAASTNAILYQGTGTLTLSQNNNISEFVTLTSGELIATGDANALGNNSTVQLNGGQLILRNDSELAFNRPLRVLQNSILISDRTTAGAGVNHSLGNIVLVSPTNALQMSAGANVSSGIASITTGTLQFATTTTFTTDTLTALNLGGFTNNNTFTKTGPGQLGVVGTGSRSGGTVTVAQGILRLEAANGLSSNNNTLNLDQGQLQLANNANTTFGGSNVVVRGTDVGIVVDRVTPAATAMVHTINQLSWSTSNLELGVFRGDNISGTAEGTVRLNNLVQNTNNRTYNYNLREFARFEMAGYSITNNTTVNSFGAGTLAQAPGTSISMTNSNATFNQIGGGGLEFSGPSNVLNGNINIDSGELRVALNTQHFRGLNINGPGRVNPGSDTCFTLSMFFDGVRQSPRLYGSTTSPAQFQDNNRFTVGSTGMLGLKGYLTFVTQPIGGRSSLLFASPPVVQVYDSLDVLIDNPDNTSPVLAFLSRTDAGGRGRLRGDSVALMVNDRATFDSLRIGGRIDSIYRIAFIIDSLVTPALESGNITVTPGPIFPGLSSVIFSLDTAIANGLDTVLVVVTLSDIDSNGIANEPVSLTQDSTKQSDITVTNFGVSDPNGIAVFKVSATKADSIDYFAVVEFQDDEPFQDSARVYFVPGPPYRLQIFNPPYSVSVNTIFFPDIQVAIFDSTNNQMWTDTNQVTLSLIPVGVPDGIITRTEVSGLATFPNISVGSGGTYFMRAAVGSVADTTLPFDIIENYYTGGDGDGHVLADGGSQNLEGIWVLRLDGSFTALDKLYDGNTSISSGNITVNSLNLVGVQAGAPNVSIDTVAYSFLSPTVGENKRVVISGAQLTGADTTDYVFTLLEAPQANAKILGQSYFGEDGRGEAAQRSDTLFLDGVKAVPQRIVFVETPGDQIANTDFGLRAQILSADDRIIPFGAANAILGFFANPSSANLSGTLSQPFTGGEAIFDSLRINLAGSDYQLSLEPGGPTHALDTAVSPPFDVYAVYNGGEGRGDSSLLIVSRGLDGFVYDGWIGGSSDWHTASNWSSQLVPRDTSRILIAPRPNQPVLFRSGTPALNGFTLANGGRLTLFDDAVLTIDSGTTGASAADGPLFLLAAGSTTDTRDNSRILIQPNARYVNRSDSRPLLESRQWIRGVRGWRQLSSPVATSYADFLDSLETQGYPGAKFDSLQPNVLWFAETDTGTTLQSWRQPSNATDSVLPGRGHYVFVFDGAGYPSAVQGGGNYADTLPVLLTATGREPDMSSGFDYTELTYTPRSLSTQADTAGGNTFFLDENVADAGWNLLGNPTPSVLHWDEPGAWTKQNLDNTVYIWDPSFGNGTGGYRYWNGTIGNINDTTLERGLLAPYQAFWVHANAAGPLLSFTHDAKSDTSQSYISRSSGTPPHIAMRLTGAGMEANSFVSFGMDGITGPDPYDAYQLEAYNDSWLMLYTQSSVQHRKPLVINHLPEPMGGELAIPLHLSAARNRLPVSGNYSLSWTVDGSWPANWGLALMDHHNEKVIPMQGRARYDFSYDAPVQPAFRLQADAEGFRSPQGVLHAAGNDLGANPVLRQQREPERPFTIVLIPNYDGSDISYRPDHAYLYPPAPNPFTYETTLAFYLPKSGQVRIEVSDMFGRSVRRVTAQAYAAGTHELMWSADELAPGTYLIRLVTDDFVSTQKAIKIR